MPLFACLALSLLPPVGGSLPVSPAITTEPPVPQSSPAARIAVVNTQAFGELINEYRQQVVTLQTEFRPTLDTLQRLGAEIQAEEDALQRLADQLTPDVRLKRTDDLERKKKDFKRRQEDLNEAAEKRAAILLNPVREKFSRRWKPMPRSAAFTSCSMLPRRPKPGDSSISRPAWTLPKTLPPAIIRPIRLRSRRRPADELLLCAHSSVG